MWSPTGARCHANQLFQPGPADRQKAGRSSGLSAAEIRALVHGLLAGEVADYQMSAWLMAAFLRGLDERETLALTDAMLDSGDVLDASKRPGAQGRQALDRRRRRQDQPVPGAAGRRLRRRGADDLGPRPRSHRRHARQARGDPRLFACSSTRERFERVVRDVGVSMIGQTDRLAPADRRIYALRDVTATVESIPLIVASILSKKLAEGIDALVLDVKVGRGAFMKDLDSARALAQGAGSRRHAARASAWSRSSPTCPRRIGRTIGNALETREAIEVLHGGGPADTRELTLDARRRDAGARPAPPRPRTHARERLEARARRASRRSR